MMTIIRSAAGGSARRIALAYRLGGRALVFAPMLVFPAIVTELVQHAAEIHLGMFVSLAAFRGLAMDPTRWAFGYAKVAGFLLTTLLVARFWAVDGVMARIPRISGRAGGRLVLGILASFAIAAADHGLARQGGPIAVAASIVDFLISTALTLYLMGALLDDERITLRWSFTAGWPKAVMMTLLAVTVFVPCQLLHLLDHRLAIGSPLAVVIPIMIWDALFVGLFAALVGSAAFVGFRYGPSWRGWDRKP
ncbi:MULTISPECIES: hypothetical protein [unclassified Sphingomonas]|uniref:hypothetical protein n=1 Tax=unclassified Sphingomonas TaxID=196159 RepID=UPI00226A2966|nr:MULTISPECIES: hypothetical protein [unclassified Sphingomonas]